MRIGQPARPVLFAMALILAMAWAVSAAAGDIWFETGRGNEIRLEAGKPAIKSAELSNFSLIWYLSAWVEMDQNLRFAADIPYIRIAPDGEGDSSKSVGNPYLGLDMGSAVRGWGGEFGLRLPLASEDEPALLVGVLADPVDRMEVFLPNILSATAGLRYQHRTEGGLGLAVRVAPLVWVDMDKDRDGDVEGWLRYSFKLAHHEGDHTYGMGLSGRYWLTEDELDGFGEKSLHEVGLFANLRFKNWRPSVRVRLPMDKDVTDILKPSVVLSLGVALPGGGYSID